METTTYGKELERLSLAYIESIDETDTFDEYVKENVDFPVTIIKQKFKTYTAYNISYEVIPGDVRVSYTAIMKKIKEEDGKS